VAKIEALQKRSRRAREALLAVGPLLEQFRQSMLAAAFRGDLTADWRTAHPNIEPASELLCRIRAERRRRWEQAELAKYEAQRQKPPKNWQDKYERPEPVDATDLPELPEGWCWARFDEVLSELRNGISPKPNDTPPGDLILRINSVRSRKVLLDELRYLPNADNYVKTYHLRDRDLLFTRYNGSLELLGVCALVQGLGNRVILYPDKLMRVRIEHQLVLPEFIEMYFASPDARQRVTSKAKTTSGQQGVSGADIKVQSVPLAPLSEQLQLVIRLQMLLTRSDELEAALVETHGALDQLDQSILAKAFRGELVPQDPRRRTGVGTADTDPRAKDATGRVS
jgi:type I restriction enzyme S subunit